MPFSRALAIPYARTRFDLVTIWRIGSDLGAVWETLSQPAGWPLWWRGLESVAELERGDTDGLFSLHRFIWKGALPYRLVMDIRDVRREPMRLIEGEATGDLQGTGTWRFDHLDGLTVVRHEWRVRAASPMMLALACLARRLVCWNHAKVMEWGGQGLARRLGAGACAVESFPALD